ncbi:MAG TPA: AI-2E family transporter [Solirubrobacteraceae bacterium]|jgi:predicted PurR-regulated permease PerM
MRFKLPTSLPRRQSGGERSEHPEDADSPTGAGAPAEPTPVHPTPAPVSAPATAGPPAAPPMLVPRWIQLVVLPLALLGIWALARAAGPVLLILVAASTGALILNPLVKRMQRARIHRGLAIFLIYVAMFAALIGIGVLLADPISTQVNRFARDVPTFVKKANKTLSDLQHWLDSHGIKVQIQQQGQTALQTLQKNVLKGTGNVVSFTRDLLGRVLTISFDLVLTLVLSVYLLVYAREIGQLVRRIMPPGNGTPEDDFPVLVQRALAGYLRGQLLFSLIMGTSAAIALWIFGTIGIFPDGARYAVFFGIWYGLAELIPYIGPIVGAAPPVLVALFNDPITALWVVLLFVLMQQLEGHFVAPQVFRISLRINPIVVILSLLIGYQIYGIVGALLALPVAAVVKETVLYLRRHLVLEPWVTTVGTSPGPGAGLEGGGPEAGPQPPPHTEPTEPDFESELVRARAGRGD